MGAEGSESTSVFAYTYLVECFFFRGEVVSVSESRTQFPGYKLRATVDNKDVRIGRLVSTAGSEVKFCFGAVSTCANLAAIEIM